MKPLRVLIVEDEIIIALELEAIIADVVCAECSVHGSIASAKRALQSEHVDLALLDINVADCKTYEIAALLQSESVPYAFVSSASREEVPSELRKAPFVKKTFSPGEIERVLEGAFHC